MRGEREGGNESDLASSKFLTRGTRDMRRLALGAVLTLLLAIVGSPAGAHSTRMYAVGTTAGSDWGGGYAEWDYQSLSAVDWSSCGFIAQVLWVYTQNSSSAWMELGDTHGWQCQNIRTYYWAEGWPGHYYEERVFTGYPSLGTYRAYEIQAVNNGEYDAYIDFNKVGASFQLGKTPGIDVGIESTSYSSSAATTNFHWMQYRTWACCTWQYWSNGSQHADSPAVWSWSTNYTHGSNRAN